MTSPMTARATYGSPYGASPRNDRKYVEAAKVKAVEVPKAPQVVQKISDPNADLPEYFRNHRYRAYYTARDREYIKTRMAGWLERSWRQYLDWRFDYKYDETYSLTSVADYEKKQREHEARMVKNKAILEEFQKSGRELTTDEILAYLDQKIPGFGTGRKASSNWEEGTTFSTCCGTVKRSALYTHYLEGDAYANYIKRVWWEKVEPGQQPAYTYNLHTEHLVIDDAAFSIHLHWNDV